MAMATKNPTFLRVPDAVRVFNAFNILPLMCFLLLVLHICYCVAPVLGENAKHKLFLGAAFLFFPVLLTAFSIYAVTRRPWLSLIVSDHDLQLLCAGFAVIMVASTIFFSFPNLIAMPAVSAFVAISFLLWWRGRIIPLVYSAIAFAMLLLTIKALGPETQAGADMLPVIKWADLEFLAGRNPYNEDYTAITIGPFYYLPVQWLLYLPFVSFGLDQRLLNLFCLFGCFALFVLALRGSPYRVASLAVFAGLCASRPAVEMIAQGQVWPIWLLLSGYAFAFIAQRHLLTAALLGVLLAANQTFILLFALAGIYELRNFGLRRASLLGLASLTIYGAFVLPFSYGSVDFFVQNYITLPRLAGVYSERLHNAVLQMSLVNILTAWDLGDLRQELQILCGLVGLAAVGLHRNMQRPHFLALAGIIYLLVVALNVQVWKYYYIPGLFLMLWSVAAASVRASSGYKVCYDI